MKKRSLIVSLFAVALIAGITVVNTSSLADITNVFWPPPL
jgi:hypothetical protein